VNRNDRVVNGQLLGYIIGDDYMIEGVRSPLSGYVDASIETPFDIHKATLADVIKMRCHSNP